MNRLFITFLVVLSVTAASVANAQEKKVLVFAAASMKNALDDVDAAFTKQSGTNVVVSYDASSFLIKQIENGAPANVFVSADMKWMDYGSEKKLIKR
jgi:molybdate transport system substrate-binding protein